MRASSSGGRWRSWKGSTIRISGCSYGGNSALASLLTGEIDEARRAFRDELRLCRELRFLPFVDEGLQGLAAVAAAEDNDLERAARLAGAADAHRYGAPVHPVETRVDSTFIEPARSRSDADAWDEAFQAGAGLSFEQAIAYALEETSAARTDIKRGDAPGV